MCTVSDYARTHGQRNGLKLVHSMKDSELPELVTASNRPARVPVSQEG